MNDTRSDEMKEAMLALLSTAASMGMDIDQMCYLAADELLSDDVLEGECSSLSHSDFERSCNESDL
ncbi:hypothetical protein ACDH60_08340 [Pseudomonas ficuserectae]|uniref:hypothetical protein n=1 Tax=Pseudomonas syringae group genomosp. 2 TaxID=251698 RepID=UPI00062B629A|nr:hypothetical protein [Pseudomonas amygdali]KKY58920.1 hypothetical protein AAY85_05125 [Pseudomonas amygdali pv. lachrymans]KPB97074.1 Unknown protein sequence [Pseudomonas amygdali pv. lachrymans]RMM51254.1 hypothetical protein ALQ79_01147 [Pseudomonas amygdali pv. lachrymans]RMP25347.1 hypothetical protein ALQ26_01831 [Pseudomonas amygdali pv. lachrymans]WIO56655.1 hypothetical protein QO021_19145 [Pseudomonas amygdali pv. lachrymans]